MSASPPRAPFGASRKIKKSRDFARLKREGKRLAVGSLAGNWRLADGQIRSRVGVITSGRLGSAVVRNRARRLLRESFRLHQHELNDAVEIVLIARPSIVGKTLTEVERDFLLMARRAGILKETAAGASN